MYAGIVGPDPEDHRTHYQPPISFSRLNSFKGLRAGVFFDYFNDASPEIVRECKKTLDFLESQGVKIVSTPIPHIEVLIKSHIITIVTEMATVVIPNFKENSTAFGDDSRLKLGLAEFFDPRDFNAAQVVRMDWFSVFFKNRIKISI